MTVHFGLFVLLTLMIASKDVSGQQLDSHKWENRLLLLIADSLDNTELQIQLDNLSSDIKGLDERKLSIYQLIPGMKRTGVGGTKEWLFDPDGLYQEYTEANNRFELILIGLDGGVKSRWNSPVDCDEIFSLIDGMPMRRAEIRNQNK